MTWSSLITDVLTERGADQVLIDRVLATAANQVPYLYLNAELFPGLDLNDFRPRVLLHLRNKYQAANVLDRSTLKPLAQALLSMMSA